MHLSMLSKHFRPHISACISVSFQTLKKTTAVVESLSTTSTRCSVTEITSLLQDSTNKMRNLHQIKFPNCLCSISTRQLEQLLWRAGSTAQHMHDSPVFFIHLNYVPKNQNKVLPPYGKFPCHQVAQYWEFHFLLINEAM